MSGNFRQVYVKLSWNVEKNQLSDHSYINVTLTHRPHFTYMQVEASDISIRASAFTTILGGS